MAQDVGHADPTASPLEGISCLQPPPQHPDCVSVPWGVGYSQSLVLELFHFLQALQIARSQREDDLGVERLPCVVGHVASTAWSERDRRVSHSSVP